MMRGTTQEVTRKTVQKPRRKTSAQYVADVSDYGSKPTAKS